MTDPANLTILMSEWDKIWTGDSENRSARSEQLLSRIGQLQDPKSIAPLLLLLSEDHEDELMFSIIHLVETFDDGIYVREVIHALPRLWTQAPRWAKIILMRILNSDTARQEFTKHLKDALPDEKSSISLILRSVVESRPEFRDRVNTIVLN